MMGSWTEKAPLDTFGFISSSSFVLGRFSATHCGRQRLLHTNNTSKCSRRKHRMHHTPRMVFLDAVHTLPEFVNHIIVSCGIGLAGIVGAKATEEVRALTSGDRRADYFDALARDVDSVRRRQELASQAGDRDWNDVAVDKFSNVLVVPEEVPEIESYEDLIAFDRLLHESPAAKRALRQGEIAGASPHFLPDPSEFELEEEDHQR